MRYVFFSQQAAILSSSGINNTILLRSPTPSSGKVLLPAANTRKKTPRPSPKSPSCTSSPSAALPRLNSAPISTLRVRRARRVSLTASTTRMLRVRSSTMVSSRVSAMTGRSAATRGKREVTRQCRDLKLKANTRECYIRAEGKMAKRCVHIDHKKYSNKLFTCSLSLSDSTLHSIRTEAMNAYKYPILPP